MVTEDSHPQLSFLENLLGQLRSDIKRQKREDVIALLPTTRTTLDALIESEFSAGYDYVLHAKDAIDQSNQVLTYSGIAAVLIASVSAIYLLISNTHPIQLCIGISPDEQSNVRLIVSDSGSRNT